MVNCIKRFPSTVIGQANDQQAPSFKKDPLTELFDNNQESLTRRALGYVGNLDDADEIVSQFFLKLAGEKSDLVEDNGGKMTADLSALFNTTASGLQRLQRRRIERGDIRINRDDPMFSQLAAPPETSIIKDGTEELSLLVDKVLPNMTEAEGRMFDFLKKHGANSSAADAAAALDITTNTARVTKHRVIKRLREAAKKAEYN